MDTFAEIEALFSHEIPVYVKGMSVKVRTLREILKDIGIKNYFSLTYFYQIDKDDICDELKISDNEYYSKSKYEIMLGSDKYRYLILMFLNFALIDCRIINTPFGIIVNVETDRIIISEENAKEILEEIANVCGINFVEDVDYSKCVNMAAKKMKRSVMKKQRKIQSLKKNKITIKDVFSGVCNKSNTISYLNVLDHTMYQIFDSYATLHKISNYEQLITGIYAGTLDKEKIDISEISW